MTRITEPKPEAPKPRMTTIGRVYLIMALFIALMLGIGFIVQFQVDVLTGIRAYVGGEGLWAKAQKDAVHHIEKYAATGNEADYVAFLREMQVPLGDRAARIELQKPEPNLAAAAAGFVRGRNHPQDVGPAIRLFRRFQHSAHMSKAIEYWAEGDRLIEEMGSVADALHREIAFGHNKERVIKAYVDRLDLIDREVTVQENLFSATLADVSRRANDIARGATYAIMLVFSALGVALSWPIIKRIRATEDALLESEEQYRGIFERVDDIIYTIEPDGTFSSISPASERLLGWRPEDWIGRPFAPIVHPDDLPRMHDLFAKAQAGEPLPAFQVRIRTAAGSYLDAEIVATPIHRGNAVAVLGVVRDITERKRREQEIHLLAATDSLTGLMNRREFTLALENELERARRYHTPLSLVMYDLDYFKKVNDTFGHDAGDRVLQAITKLVQENIRSVDVAARWGGEEFMILMPQSDLVAARQAAEKLRLAIANCWLGDVGNVTASFGVSQHATQDDMNSLLKKVDDALYRAKGKGRNRVEIA